MSAKCQKRTHAPQQNVYLFDQLVGAFERWDSLAHMHLLLAIEEKLGCRLDPDEAVRIECLTDIAVLLDQASTGRFANE